MKSIVLLILISYSFIAWGQTKKSSIPANFVRDYYQAYTNTPTAGRLSPFYADSATIDDPTYDWVGKTKERITSCILSGGIAAHCYRVVTLMLPIGNSPCQAQNENPFRRPGSASCKRRASCSTATASMR